MLAVRNNDMKINLDDKLALITFCGNAWITDIASTLAGAGAKVVVAGDDGEKVRSAVGLLENEGHDALGITMENFSLKEIERTVETAGERYGRIDILVNNFNVEMVKPLLDMSEEEWNQVVNANLTTACFYCKTAGRYMVRQGGGSIINIISGLAERGVINGTGYCASMGGVLQLTRALALEWAKRNVRVNAIGIGWKETKTPDGKKDSIESYIPMKRRARPEDITPMVLFLASEASSYMSGNIYHVDGGLMARG
jgi:NAD(P)-dependent dehydrogenase (short-subunit alcohol dehydrogenase family)